MDYLQYLTEKSMNESVADLARFAGKPLAAILRRARGTKALVHESPEAASAARRAIQTGEDVVKNSRARPFRKAAVGAAAVAASIGAGMMLGNLRGKNGTEGASYEDGSPIVRETSGDNTRPWPDNLVNPLDETGKELLTDEQVRMIDAIAYFLPTSEFDQNTKTLLMKVGPWNDDIAKAAELRLVQAQNMWDDMIEYGSEAAVQRQESKGDIVTEEQHEDSDDSDEESPDESPDESKDYASKNDR